MNIGSEVNVYVIMGTSDLTESVLEPRLQFQNAHLSQHLMLSTIVVFVILDTMHLNQMFVKNVP